AGPAMLANFALIGWFIGMQNARAVLVLQLLMNGINVALEFWFVMGLGWGVAGVAWASLAAQLIALGVGLFLARRILRRIGGVWRLDLLMQAERVSRMLSINRDIFLRTIFMSGCTALMTVVGARSGDTVLAANAIMINLQFIAS